MAKQIRIILDWCGELCFRSFVPVAVREDRKGVQIVFMYIMDSRFMYRSRNVYYGLVFRVLDICPVSQRRTDEVFICRTDDDVQVTGQIPLQKYMVQLVYNLRLKAK